MEIDHPPHHHTIGLSPLRLLLFLQLLPDVPTERHLALRVRAVFGVIAAQRYQLLTDGTVALLPFLAHFRVFHNPLHFMTTQTTAIRVTTLARVYQRLDTTLNKRTFHS